MNSFSPEKIAKAFVDLIENKKSYQKKELIGALVSFIKLKKLENQANEILFLIKQNLENTLEVEIKSAKEFKKEELKKIKEKFFQVFPNKILKIKVKKDPSLLKGGTIKIKDKILDLSALKLISQIK